MKKCKHAPYSHPHNEDGNQHERNHSIPPHNPDCSDSRIYGNFSSQKSTRYAPHSDEHIFFKPRKKDDKPPVSIDRQISIPFI